MEMATKASSTGNSNMVYVAISDAKLGCCKVGITGNLKKKLHQLEIDISGPFRCVYACEVESEDTARQIEKYILDCFGDDKDRERYNQELLKAEYKIVIAVINLYLLDKAGVTLTVKPYKPRVEEDQVVAKAFITEGDVTESDKPSHERKRRASFNFEMVRLQPGTELEFIWNREIKVTVVNDRFVTFDGEELVSLSNAAAKAFRRLFWGHREEAMLPLIPKTPYSGPRFWIYNDSEFIDETLEKRRRRMYD